MKLYVMCLLALFIGLAGCSKKAPAGDAPFGISQGMSWDDIKECCQIEKTAMVTRKIYALKLVTTPKPDDRFDMYYVHLTRSDGVFGLNAGTEPMPKNQAHTLYNQLEREFSSKFGSPTKSDANNIVWENPPSDAGLFRVTLSKKDDGPDGQVSVFYIFNNNTDYQ